MCMNECYTMVPSLPDLSLSLCEGDLIGKEKVCMHEQRVVAPVVVIVLKEIFKGRVERRPTLILRSMQI